MNLILNLLLAVVVISGIYGARLTADLTKAQAAKYGKVYYLSRGVLMLVSAGLYVWLAVESGYWQFAAIPAVSFLLTLGIVAAKPAAEVKS